MDRFNGEIDFTTRLAEERPRLVRLCAWFTGRPEAAEDLAQETLLAAWKNQEKLSAPEKVKPWLSAIARNICMSWSRKNSREPTQMALSIDTTEESLEDRIPDEVNLEHELDRAELSRLLDHALALLPAPAAELLVEHYVKESSQAEIAEKMGIKAGTVAVRLQRGKQTMQRLLRTHLQEEAQAFGMLPHDSPTWEETNIWCPNCGRARLLGQFQKDTPDARFAMRCPHCHPDAHTIMVGIDLTVPYYARLIGSIRTYKPAYTRLLAGLAPFYTQALENSTTPCPACGRPVVVHAVHVPEISHGMEKKGSKIQIHCSACDWETNTSLSGLIMALPDAQRFWRENPRIRTFPIQEIETQGSQAYVTHIQSLTGAAELTVITRRDTLALIGVHSNVQF